jgi:hypothetical protein
MLQKNASCSRVPVLASQHERRCIQAIRLVKQLAKLLLRCSSAASGRRPA